MALSMPEHLGKALMKEKAFVDCSLAALMRRITKWHRGVGASRHPDAPPYKISARASSKRMKKMFLIDKEDVAYLDDISARTGLARHAVLLVLAFQWFGQTPFARKE